MNLMNYKDISSTFDDYTLNTINQEHYLVANLH